VLTQARNPVAYSFGAIVSASLGKVNDRTRQNQVLDDGGAGSGPSGEHTVSVRAIRLSSCVRQ
jgi:hypothetical protein